MPAPKLRQSWISACMSLVVGVASAAFPTAATAQDVTPTLQKTGKVSHVEAGKIAIKANGYANTGEGVAIIAFIGDDMTSRGHTAESVGAQLVKMFADQYNVKASAFVGHNGDRNTAITFVTKQTSFGPNGLGNALKNMKAAAEQFKLEQKFSPSEQTNE